MAAAAAAAAAAATTEAAPPFVGRGQGEAGAVFESYRDAVAPGGALWTAYCRPDAVPRRHADGRPHRIGSWSKGASSSSSGGRSGLVYHGLDGRVHAGADAYASARVDFEACAWPSPLAAAAAAVGAGAQRQPSLPGGVPEAALLRSRLTTWGVPGIIADAYEAAGVGALHAWQWAVLEQDACAVLRGCNALYTAPTGGGKTLVAEVAMLRTLLLRRRKVLLVVPFVSMAIEKALHLARVWGGAGFTVRAFYNNQGPPSMRGVDVGVATYERANSLLNRLMRGRRGGGSSIGCVVVDEVHMLGDGDRGAVLELLLMKLLLAAPQRRAIDPLAVFAPAPTPAPASITPPAAGADPVPRYAACADDTQVVAMSATLPNLAALGVWLRASVHCHTTRLLPLERYVVADGVLYDATATPLAVYRSVGGAVTCTPVAQVITRCASGAAATPLPPPPPPKRAAIAASGGSAPAPLPPTTASSPGGWAGAVAGMRYDDAARRVCVMPTPHTPAGVVLRGALLDAPPPPSALLAHLVEETAVGGRSALVFCATRAATNEAARALGAALAASPALAGRHAAAAAARAAAVQELHFTPCGADPVLVACVTAGVGFHHAGLTMEERDIVERAFRAGALYALAATTTIGTGVNLPARRVIFSGVATVVRRPAAGGWLHLVTSLTRFSQMAGRAGRYGMDTAGEVFVLLDRRACELSTSVVPPPVLLATEETGATTTVSTSRPRPSDAPDAAAVVDPLLVLAEPSDGDGRRRVYYEPITVRVALRTARTWLAADAPGASSFVRAYASALARGAAPFVPSLNMTDATPWVAGSSAPPPPPPPPPSDGSLRDRGLSQLDCTFLLLHGHELPVHSSILAPPRHPPPATTTPAAARQPFRRALLDLIASGHVTAVGGLHLRRLARACLATYTGASDEWVGGAVDDALAYLVEHRFVALASGASAALTAAVTATQLGMAAFAAALPPEDALAVATALAAVQRDGLTLDACRLHCLYLLSPPSALDASPLALAALRADMAAAAASEPAAGAVFTALQVTPAAVAALVAAADAGDSGGGGGGGGGAAAAAAEARLRIAAPRLLTAFVLDALLCDTPIDAVAARYTLERGRVQALQSTAAAYAGQVCALAKALNWHMLHAILADLALRLDFSVRPEVRALMAVPDVSAQRARALLRHGLTSVDDLAGADVAAVRNALLLNFPFDRRPVDAATSSAAPTTHAVPVVVPPPATAAVPASRAPLPARPRARAPATAFAAAAQAAATALAGRIIAGARGVLAATAAVAPSE